MMNLEKTVLGIEQKFKALTGIELRSILPKVLTAGESAGMLTEEGAAFLDPTDTLRPGIPVAPCEGTRAPAWRPPIP